ncbi:TPA: hypothetical protein QDZ66_000343 [Pluralibacter gergoviae]|uniref:Lipoprotein n=1 Tax=Pluralibacter gergoviae TaxID=61647 RepID=A0A0F0VGQ6_PLUGE|nr:hypothetical protein [Pluralibacter gergoviae]KJM58588.1 hypothetical protein SS31_20820 [Pluralibacter gergoviae]KMK08714.1 hypothetical protein ABW06_24515 [Pluralibacter gergoviae]KMK25717.1 hypothetical protein ABW10_06955 [Pluralibacter gergoviae]MBL3694157.1 hypothetical protein [Pluralibacter gergoviae]OUR04237.1 hypothetical protein B5M10_03185 [Pluralibacter gergoviae]
MKKIFIVLALFSLAGCSTTPVSPKAAKEVPAVIKYQKNENKTALTIIRDKGFIAGGCEITIYINGDQLANLDTSEKVTAYVDPGEVIIGAGFIGSGLCHGPERKERSFTIKSNTPRYFRVFIDQSANVDILASTIE